MKLSQLLEYKIKWRSVIGVVPDKCTEENQNEIDWVPLHNKMAEVLGCPVTQVEYCNFEETEANGIGSYDYGDFEEAVIETTLDEINGHEALNSLTPKKISVDIYLMGHRNWPRMAEFKEVHTLVVGHIYARGGKKVVLAYADIDSQDIYAFRAKSSRVSEGRVKELLDEPTWLTTPDGIEGWLRHDAGWTETLNWGKTLEGIAKKLSVNLADIETALEPNNSDFTSWRYNVFRDVFPDINTDEAVESLSPHLVRVFIWEDSHHETPTDSFPSESDHDDDEHESIVDGKLYRSKGRWLLEVVPDGHISTFMVKKKVPG